MKNGRALSALLAVALLAVCAVGAVSWEADAIETGSSSAPLASLKCNMDEAYQNHPFYVVVGGSVSIQKVDGYWANYVDSSTGLTVSDGNLTGTFAKAGDFTVSCYRTSSDGIAMGWPLYLRAVQMETYHAYLYYNANGGSGAPSTQSDSIYASSASGSKSFTVSSAVPTKSGCTFLGWSESPSATSASYQPGGTISVPYGDAKTLYAVWQEDSYTSTLYYNANGGSGAPTTQTDTHTSTSAHTFPISDTQPKKSGFVFLGWSESPSATSASYQPGGTISVPYDGDKTLYAVWRTAQLDISSEPATKSLKVGQSWSYTPITDIDGCTVSVSGADWLTVSGGEISGTPTSSGSYSVTVTVSKTGYTSDSQSFTLKVYSVLGFDSDPSAAGVFVYAE